MRFKRNNWWGLLSFIAAGFLIFIFLFFSYTGSYPFTTTQVDVLFLVILISSVCYLAFFAINHLLHSYLTWNKHFALRFFSTLALLLIAFYLVSFLFVEGYFWLNVDQEIGSFFKQVENERLKYRVILIVFTLFTVLIDFSWFSYNTYAVTQIRSQQIKREQLNLQFEALKSQLSPHFLFNSLNTVSSLIYRDKRIAEKFIRNLAITFKHLIDNNQRKLISLEEELMITKSYIYLMEIRFENAFKVNIDIAEEYMQKMVPSLVIQMLIENALKHNVVSKDNPLKVDLRSNSNDTLTIRNKVFSKPVHVIIENAMLRKPNKKQSHNLGLNNIKSRYKFFTNKEVEIERNEFFSVTIPLV